MSNFRHSRVWSWQRRIPMVEGAWPARVAVTLTASPPRSSSLLPRRPKRPPPPRLSSPLPKLKYNLGRQSSVQHRISLIPFSCQVKLYQDWGWKNFSAHSCCGFMYYLKGRHIKNRLWLVIFLVVTGEAPPLGCFIKDTLKKNKNRNPVRNWGVPRKNISRRREWSNKSRGLLNTLKVWRKIGEIGGRRGIDYGCDTDYQVLKAVFLVHCPDSVFHNLDKPETYNLKSRTI